MSVFSILARQSTSQFSSIELNLNSIVQLNLVELEINSIQVACNVI